MMTWTPLEPPLRQSPQAAADERTMLRSWLDFQRATLLGKLAGLSAAQLAIRAVPPSTMSLIGLLRHSTDGEIALFRAGALSEDVIYLYGDDTPLGGDFDGVSADITADSVTTDVRLWLEACADSQRIEAAIDGLDALGAEQWPGHGPASLRWVMVHMIEEYARHNGHADLIREVIDGSTGY